MITIDSDLEMFVIIAAFRYSLGRRTYAVRIMTEFLKKNWANIPKTDRDLIQREIDEAIEKGCAGSPLIDVPEWEGVLLL